MPARRRFASPRGRAAAAVICAATTGAFAADSLAAADVDLEDRLRPDGMLDTVAGPVSALDVAKAAAVLLAKLIGDVEHTLGASPDVTLGRMGLWVATDELATPDDRTL